MSNLITYDMLIDGEFVQASDGTTFESINPATGKSWAQIPAARAKDVDKAV